MATPDIMPTLLGLCGQKSPAAVEGMDLSELALGRPGPEPEFARLNGLDHNPSIGGHVALQTDDLDGVIARLDAAGIAYSLTGEFAIPGMRHLYVCDPAMNLLEINEMLE